MMQTQIPSGLQALMQASQVLSSQASPTAPGPQGPQPTIAERVNQQIKQTAAPPQTGIAGLSPNMRDIGQQAGVAGQIMAQKAAQQEQIARNPEAIAQMAAQMMQSKGVAGLPAKMGFKEGGIIGFDGTQGSVVEGILDPKEIRAKLVEAVRSGDAENAQFYSKQLRLLQEGASAPAPVEPKVVVPSRLNAPVKREASDGIATPAVTGRQPEPPKPPVSTAQPTDVGIQTVLPKPAPRAAPPARPAPAKPETQPAPVAKIPETKVDASGIAEPTIASLASGINTLAPQRAEAFNTQAAADEEARKKLKASMEDLNAKEIAALEESKKTRKQLAESKAERDQFNRVRAFFEDLGNRGSTSYRTVQEGIFARDEAERLADLAHDKAVILLQKAQQAEKLGDLDRAAALKKDAQQRLVEEDKNRMTAAQITGKLAETGYTQRMETARTDAQIKSANVRTQADIDQRDREAKERFAIERQKLAQAERLGADTKMIGLANDAFARWTQAEKLYQEVLRKNMVFSNMPEADLKNPANKKMKDDADKAIGEAQRGVEAQWQLYESISGKLFGGAGVAKAGASSGINPAAAAAELARRQQKQ